MGGKLFNKREGAHEWGKQPYHSEFIAVKQWGFATKTITLTKTSRVLFYKLHFFLHHYSGLRCNGRVFGTAIPAVPATGFSKARIVANV